MTNSHTLRRVLTGTLAALTLASCASIPHGSSVHRVSDENDQNEAAARYEPAGPSEDATPAQIVRGYLDAMLAYPVDRGTAKQFLTDTAAEEWEPDASTLVYSDADVLTPNAHHTDKADVKADISLTAKLDADGHLSAEDHGKSAEFELSREDGQWRISSAPPGSLISRAYFIDHFRAFNLYYFDPSAERMVPDPVHVAVGEQTGTKLVSALLRGPRAGVQKYVRTFLPDDVTLGTSTPISSKGAAEVDLSGDLSDSSDTRLEAVSAQLAWTLGQVERIDEVRITDNNGVISPGGHRAHRPQTWDEYEPVQHPQKSYAVQSGKVQQLTGTTAEAVEGPWGAKKHDIDGVSVAGDTIAILTGERLKIDRLSESDVTTVRARGLVSVEVDDTESVLVGINDDDKSRVAVYDGDRLRTVLNRSGKDHAISQLTLSPDGARYAIMTDDTVQVGLVRRDEDGDIERLAPPDDLSSDQSSDQSSGQSAEAVAWSSPTDMLVAKKAETGFRFEQRAIDGSRVSGEDFDANLRVKDVRSISVTPDADTVAYALDKSDHVWALREGERWKRVDGSFGVLDSGH